MDVRCLTEHVKQQQIQQGTNQGNSLRSRQTMMVPYATSSEYHWQTPSTSHITVIHCNKAVCYQPSIL